MMRFWILALLFTVFSGCATKGPALIGGIEDVIRCPKGTVLEGIALPTVNGTKENIIVPKDGMWISLDAWNRYEHTKGNGQ